MGELLQTSREPLQGHGSRRGHQPLRLQRSQPQRAIPRTIRNPHYSVQEPASLLSQREGAHAAPSSCLRLEFARVFPRREENSHVLFIATRQSMVLLLDGRKREKAWKIP